MVSSVPPRGNSIQFEGDDTGEPEMVEVKEIIEKLPAQADDDGKGDDDSTDSSNSGDDDPWSEGDACQFMDGRKQMQGVIRSVEGDVAKIKCEGTRKLFAIPTAKLEDQA